MNIDIDAIKCSMLVKYSQFGIIVANLKYVESRDIYSNGQPTLGTNGNTIYYHPDFINSLTYDEQVFVFAHEVCHVAFDHILRGEGKDPELWNIATDAVINALLSKDGLKMVDGGVNIPEAINYDSEQMYNKLLEEKQKSNQMNQSKQGSNEGNFNQDSSNRNNLDQQYSKNNSTTKQQNIDAGHDTHSMWEKAIEMRKEQENKEDNSTNAQGQPKKEDLEQKSNSLEGSKNERSFLNKLLGKDKNTKNNIPKKDIEKMEEERNRKIEEQVKKLYEMGERKVFEQNRIERKKQLQELRNTLARQSYNAGSGTNEEIIKIDGIGISNSLIDWRKLLKENIRYNIDWSYKNATIEDGVVTPYLEDIPKSETEIVLDTSGSIEKTLLRNFLRECKNVLQTSKIRVGCFDDKFYGFTEIKNENDIDNMTFIGGGGTNFNAAINAFSKRVENKIIFTDGAASMPNTKMDVIWIVFGNRKINPIGGKVIYIDEKQLNKLSMYNLDGYNEKHRK